MQPRPVSRASSLVSSSTTSGADVETATSSFLSTNDAPEGDMPRDLAFTPDGASVLVVNRDTDNLMFFDVATRAVTAVVAVGDNPVDVAVSPDGVYAVVTNLHSDSVTIVDIATQTVAATVPVTGSQPFAVEVTSDSAFAVVGVTNDGTNSSFSVISLSTLMEVRSFASAPQGNFGVFGNAENGIFGNLFSHFAVSPDNITIVLPDRGGDRVVLYDLSTGLELASLTTAAQPFAVDISLDGTMAVVSTDTTNTITVIDLVSHSITNSFAIAENLSAFDPFVRITHDNTHAIAAISNNVVFVNLTTGLITATLFTGAVGDIEISFDGQYAFVSNFNSRVIDIATQSIVATLTIAPSAEAAMSPVAHRAVALNNHFGEDLHFYNTNGASGFFEGRALSGTLPEGDATRTLAVSPDGSTVITGNVTSRNVSIIDVTTGTIRSYVDTGDRVKGIAVTPDGTHAVVANTDAHTVSIIDLSTDTVVKTLSVLFRPVEVLISPDSQMAYVTSVQGQDRLHFIQLAGAASSVVGSIVTGQMGTSFGYTYSETSEMALSDDGSTIAVAISFDDELLIVDTATRMEVARVPLPAGSFPLKVDVSPDGSTAYVLNTFGDSVSVVNVDGAASSLITTLFGFDQPSTVNVDAAGAFVYVGSFGSGAPALSVINAATNTVVRTISLPGVLTRAAHLSQVDSILYVAGFVPAGTSLLYRISAEGVFSEVIDSTPLTNSPSALVYSESLDTAIVAQPIPDGVDMVQFPAVVPPTIATGNTINGGTTNRSGIRELTFSFSGAVTVGSAAALNLFNHTTSQSINLAAATLQNDGTSFVTWDLSAVALPDGEYTAELSASATAPALRESHTVTFHKLIGDVSGDGVVNATDFVVVDEHFDPTPGLPFRAGDANGDGLVNASDFVAVDANFHPLPLPLLDWDFGDAPEVDTSFPTTLARDGARHIITGNTLFLGADRDAEADGQPNAMATGDGADENGIGVDGLTAGANVVVTVTSSGVGFVNGWVDFNQDGDWNDATEHVFIDEPVVAGSNNIPIVVPAGAILGTALARFRLTSAAGHSYLGIAPDGEVEDYALTVTAPSPETAAKVSSGDADVTPVLTRPPMWWSAIPASATWNHFITLSDGSYSLFADSSSRFTNGQRARFRMR